MERFRCNCDECNRHDEAATTIIRMAKAMQNTVPNPQHFENVQWMLNRHGLRLALVDEAWVVTEL